VGPSAAAVSATAAVAGGCRDASCCRWSGPRAAASSEDNDSSLLADSATTIPVAKLDDICPRPYDTIRYDTRCYFNVRSKADISQLNLPHGTDN